LYHIPDINFPDQSYRVDERDIEIMEDHLEEYMENNNKEYIYFEYFEYLSEELQIMTATDFPSARQNYLNFISHAL